MPCSKLILAPPMALIRAAWSASSDQAATLLPSVAKLIAMARIRFRFVMFDLLCPVRALSGIVPLIVAFSAGGAIPAPRRHGVRAAAELRLMMLILRNLTTEDCLKFLSESFARRRPAL